MSLIVGIDGGGSGCRVAVADAAGRVIAKADGGPANIATDADGAVKSILETVRQAFRSAVGQDHEAELRSARVGLGLAGANAKGAAAPLLASLPFQRFLLETDALTAARGALGDRDGLLAAIGTGSVFVLQKAGQRRQIGGWGFVLGDEGSGASLGRAALAKALAASDGMTKRTPYLEAILTRFGGPEGIVAFSFAATPAEFAALAPELISSTDPACRQIWSDSVAKLSGLLATILAGQSLPVTFIGGLGPAYAEALPDFPQTPARGTALDGALLLAKEVA